MSRCVMSQILYGQKEFSRKRKSVIFSYSIRSKNIAGMLMLQGPGVVVTVIHHAV